MINVAAWMPIWGRHDVLKLSLAGLAAMQSRWRAKGYDLNLYVAYTDPTDLNALLNYYGYPAGAKASPNEPLSDKHNALLSHILEFSSADYFLQVGSDDVFLPEGDQLYFDAMDGGVHNVGCTSIYFMDAIKERAVEWVYDERDANKLFGAGRLFSREAVEIAFEDGGLWDRSANRSLDFISEDHLIDLGYRPERLNEEAPYIVDIKSDTNIWSFDRYKNGKSADYFELADRMRQAVNLHL